MIYQTKYFGEIECSEDKVFHFPSGLPGFEDEHTFLLIPFEGSHGTMFSLQSTTTPSLSFITMDPFSLLPDYQPVLSSSDLRQFDDAFRWDDLSYCVLCSVKNPVQESTVNLRCPIAIHLDTREAHQIIMDTDKYNMRHLLTEFSKTEEAETC